MSKVRTQKRSRALKLLEREIAKQKKKEASLPKNANGLTFYRWLRAIGADPSYEASNTILRRAWQRGDDTADWRLQYTGG